MTKTTNYHLNQWDADDPVRREDFNADNAKLDAALQAIRDTVGALIVTGTYTGTAETAAAKQTITLGFQPRFLLVRDTSYLGSSISGDIGWSTLNLGIAVPGHGHGVYNQYQVLEITEDGFIAGGTNALFNTKSKTYVYLAVR